MSRLTLAIPSKGRLKEQCESFLSACGFALRQRGGDRGYQAVLSGLPDVDVLLLSASEIAGGLISGALHAGVTGEDLLHEGSADLSRDALVIKRLGFGGADAVVAVPQSWLDVSTMADLEAAGALFRARHGRRMRVATKYLRLTRTFFAERSVGEYRIVESAGATEAAPASGAAELIVDITSTGATLRANGLKILNDGIILQSQAALTGSLKAEWSDGALASLRGLLDAIEAKEKAGACRLLSAAQDIPAEAMSANGLRQHGAANQVLCDAGDVGRVGEALAASGLGPVAVSTLDFIFTSDNPVYDNFYRAVRAKC